ncbi:DUF222 domain-containing protein [Georgenia sp. M64]|uniref:HNH endonuclease signature motif containing protein n=1 Tax=Georgenia sp. M64 TaxID=3120520 RepID=UPI0030E5CA45
MSSRRGRRIDLAAVRARGWDSTVEAYLAEVRDVALAHARAAGTTPDTTPTAGSLALTLTPAHGAEAATEEAPGSAPTPDPAAGARRLRLVDAVYAEPVELAVAFGEPDSDTDSGIDPGGEPGTTDDTESQAGAEPGTTVHTECRTGAEADPETEADDTGMPSAEEITAAAAVLARAVGLYGAPLAAALDAVPVHGQDPDVLIELIANWNRMISWSTARRGEAAAALADAAAEHGRHLPGRTVDPVTVAGTEIAMRLTTTKQAAIRMVRTSSLLNGPLTSTGLSLEHGAIDPAKAQVIADALEHVPHQIAWDIEDAVLPGAQGRTPQQLRRDLARALISVDHHEAERRHRQARTARRVCHPRALPDGMASLYAVLPAEDAIALDLTLDHAARHAKSAGDARTMDQLRADTLATIGVNALTTGQILLGPVQVLPHAVGIPPVDGAPAVGTPAVGTPPVGATSGARPSAAPPPASATPDCSTSGDRSSAGPAASAGGSAPVAISLGSAPVRVHVTVPLTTLLGGGEPGTLEGYGPIDPATARALALRGTWRRLVTDPLTGTVLDHGRTTYRPPKDLADLVRDRDGTCVRPGCGTAAARCELDHSLAWSQGGTTALTNLGCACGGDHDLKTCGHFKVRQIRSGVFEWTSSLTGLIYRRESDGSVTYRNPQLPDLPRRTAVDATGTEPPGADPPY